MVDPEAKATSCPSGENTGAYAPAVSSNCLSSPLTRSCRTSADPLLLRSRLRYTSRVLSFEMAKDRSEAFEFAAATNSEGNGSASRNAGAGWAGAGREPPAIQ